MNTYHFEPYDGDGNPEYGPPCPECKAEMVWEDCHACDGDGYIESEADDYTDRVVTEKCMVCLGDGGFWFCDNCAYTVTNAELREPQELNQQEDPGVRQP